MSLFLKLLGVVLILAGLPLFWTPVPIGAVLILAGLGLLAANSSTVQSWLRGRRERHPRLDRWMIGAEKYLPRPLKRSLADTHPDRS